MKKIIENLSALLVLLLFSLPVIAMDQDEEPKSAPSPLLKRLDLTFSNLAENFEKACGMPQSLAQAEIFGQIAQYIESNMPMILSDNDTNYKNALIRFRAKSLRQQGGLLRNLALKEQSFEERLKQLSQAKDCMAKSYALYQTELHEKESAMSSLDYLETIVQHLRDTYFDIIITIEGSNNPKNNPEKIMDLCLEGVKTMEESKKIEIIRQAVGVSQKKKEYKTHQYISSMYGLEYYTTIASNVKIFQEPATLEKYRSLVKNADLLKQIITLFEDYLIPSLYFDLPFTSVKKQQKNRSTTTIESSSRTIEQWFPLFNSGFGIVLFYNTYCGILESAGNTIAALSLDPSNERLKTTYQTRGNEHLDLAFKTYKTKIYQGEYQNNQDKERDFILARLESLVGNEQPLKDFYSTLRKEHKEHKEQSIAQKIREAQKVQRIQEEVERQAEETRVVQLQAMRDKAQSQAQEAFESSPFTEQFPISFSDQRVEKEEVSQPREKVKTRGVPRPGPVIESKTDKNRDAKQQKRVVTLDPEKYDIFLALTGESNNRNITLQNVNAVLGSLGCTFSKAAGSHNKATAPNNKMWTIPPAWDGPIPPHYRHQLLNFLLEDMGIITGALKVKCANN